MNFKIGENVFMTAGNNVMEARVERPQYGRYVVAYKGSGYEAEGHICVSGTRLFHSYDEAMANIRKVPAAELYKKGIMPDSLFIRLGGIGKPYIETNYDQPSKAFFWT